MKLTLPTDSNERKDVPIVSGCYNYFPAALAGVAKHSKMGNDKHNPGQPLHHSRGKSSDHADCIGRHLMDIADIEAHIRRQEKFMYEGKLHIGKEDAVAALLAEANANAWRALALSQELHEKYAGAPLAPAARLSEPTSLGLQSLGGAAQSELAKQNSAQWQECQASREPAQDRPVERGPVQAQQCGQTASKSYPYRS